MAALPGFMILVAVWMRLGRIAFVRNPDALRDAIGLRDPRTGDLEEQQLANVVGEMAIAAGRQPPRLALVDSAACNAGLLGEGERATIIVTRGLLIGSIARRRRRWSGRRSLRSATATGSSPSACCIWAC